MAGTARPDGTSIRSAEEVGALQQSTKGQLSVLDDALSVQARCRRLRRGGLAVVTLLLVVLVALVLGTGRQPSAGMARTGAVTGYIQPCSGLPFPQFTSTGARLFSAAATVEARRGKEYLKPVGGGISDWVFPAAVAARERVSQNQQFRLGRLSPGRYVILAHYAGGNAITWLDVSVIGGRTADVDLPDTCL